MPLPWNASPGIVSFTFLEEIYSWNLLSSIWSRLSSVPFSLNDLSIFFAAAEGSLPIDTYSFNTYTVSSLIAESRISNALLFKQSNAFLSAAHLSNNLVYSFLLCAASNSVATRQTTSNANSWQDLLFPLMTAGRHGVMDAISKIFRAARCTRFRKISRTNWNCSDGRSFIRVFPAFPPTSSLRYRLTPDPRAV